MNGLKSKVMKAERDENVEYECGNCGDNVERRAGPLKVGMLLGDDLFCEGCS